MAEMTQEQFACCHSGRSGPITESARLVLVEGIKARNVEQMTGHTEKSIRNAMARIRRHYRRYAAAFLLDQRNALLAELIAARRALAAASERDGQFKPDYERADSAILKITGERHD